MSNIIQIAARAVIIETLNPMIKTLRLLSLFLCAGLYAVVVSGCASTSENRSTGEYIDDQTINARVKTAFLRDESVAGFNVSTTTFDGVVQLSGFVASEDQRQQAENLAMGIAGVKTVINNLSVNPGGEEQLYGAPRDESQIEEIN